MPSSSSSSAPEAESPHRCPDCCPGLDDPPPSPEWTVNILEMPPELQAEIFLHLPSLASVVSLRLACRQLNAVYQPNEDKIKSSLRDQMAGPFREYYELLQRLKFPDDSIKYPPPGGWPAINPHNFVPYNKTDFAVSVLKHFPFIDDRGFEPSAETNIGFKSDVIDYSTVEERPDDAVSIPDSDGSWPEGYMEEDRLDPDYDDEKITGIRHIIKLARGHEGGGIFVMLDTFTGTVFEEEIGGDARIRASARDYCDKRMDRLRRLDELFYRDCSTWELNEWDADQRLVPPARYDHEKTAADGEPMPDNGYAEEDKFHWVAHLYHKFGWPGEPYRKNECLEAIGDFLERWQDAEDDIWLRERARQEQIRQQGQ